MESKKAFRYIIISYSTPIKNVLKFLAEYEDTFYKKIYDALLILLDHHQKEALVLNREIAKTQKRMSSPKALRISVPHLRISLPRTCKTDFLKLLPWIKDDPNINLVQINQISQEVKDVLEFNKNEKIEIKKPPIINKSIENKKLTEQKIINIAPISKPTPPPPPPPPRPVPEYKEISEEEMKKIIEEVEKEIVISHLVREDDGNYTELVKKKIRKNENSVMLFWSF